MKKWRVLIPEIHYSHRIVEAESKEEAVRLAGDVDEEYLEYSHSLDIDPDMITEAVVNWFSS